jgi:hypothetical protein
MSFTGQDLKTRPLLGQQLEPVGSSGAVAEVSEHSATSPVNGTTAVSARALPVSTITPLWPASSTRRHHVLLDELGRQGQLDGSR